MLRFIIINAGETHEGKHILHGKAISSMWRRLAAMHVPLNLSPSLLFSPLLSQQELVMPCNYSTSVAEMNEEAALLATEISRGLPHTQTFT